MTFKSTDEANQTLTMRLKYVSLNDDRYRYLCRCRSAASDPLVRELRAETAALGDASRMQITLITNCCCRACGETG